MCFFSPGTNNARLAAMLRQLAQYHAKDPNNLFMVRLAQVRAIVNDWVCGERSQGLEVLKLILTVRVCAPAGSDSPGQRNTDTLSLPQRQAADESGGCSRAAHGPRFLP